MLQYALDIFRDFKVLIKMPPRLWAARRQRRQTEFSRRGEGGDYFFLSLTNWHINFCGAPTGSPYLCTLQCKNVFRHHFATHFKTCSAKYTTPKNTQRQVPKKQMTSTYHQIQNAKANIYLLTLPPNPHKKEIFNPIFSMSFISQNCYLVPTGWLSI